MKKIILLACITIATAHVSYQSYAQTKLLNQLGNLTQNNNQQVADGLKAALKLGAQNASKQLSATDGYFKNAAIKILLPPEVQQVERVLRNAGMGKIVDDAILKMNRAAESAAKSATPIFVNAITSMSINDGIGILTGGSNAATMYLQSKTTSQLTTAFRPTIQNALGKSGATKAWNKVFTTYNKIPLVQKKVNTDLAGYVTEQALKGLFTTISNEEAKIRANPAGQASEIIRKVFSNL